MLDYHLIILEQKAALPKYPSICKWHVSQQGWSRFNSCKGQECDKYSLAETCDLKWIGWSHNWITRPRETLWKSLLTLSFHHCHHCQRLQRHKGSLPLGPVTWALRGTWVPKQVPIWEECLRCIYRRPPLGQGVGRPVCDWWLARGPNSLWLPVPRARVAVRLNICNYNSPHGRLQARIRFTLANNCHPSLPLSYSGPDTT